MPNVNGVATGSTVAEVNVKQFATSKSFLRADLTAVYRGTARLGLQ